VLLGAIAALGPFTIDLYLPAFPAIARELQASAFGVQLTLAATTAGHGIGQLVIGPVSDAIGRRPPLPAATALHVVSRVVVMLADGIPLLTAGRIGQGIGAAGSAVIGIAIVRALFDGQLLVSALGRVSLVMMLAPVVAPLVGSQLLAVASWRWLFAGLAAYGSIMFVGASLLLRETRRGESVAPGRGAVIQR
jgi:DHA1 family bicyclomycin/chloramphenicol resistance-like MFS transporter